MNIALIGSNSFLAQYIAREFVQSGSSPVLFGVTRQEEFPNLQFSRFQLPEFPLNLPVLLDYDIIIYTAGAGIQTDLHESSDMIYELNCFTPIRIMNFLAANNFKGKVITFGSYFEIGNEQEERFYTEPEVALSDKPVPNHYASSKRILTRFLTSAHALPVHFHFILPNIYGPGENPSRLIPYLVDAIRHGTEIKLTSGEQVRQYLYASDIAGIVVKVSCNLFPGGLYNLCNQEPIRVKSLVHCVFRAMDKEAEFRHLTFGTNHRTDTYMPFLLLNNAKAHAELGFNPSVSLPDGIMKYLQK